MNQIARVMNLHAGKPFERGGGYVVIVADAQDGRVRVEAGKNRIFYRHNVAPSASRSRTTVHRIIAPNRSSSPRQMKKGVYPTFATNPPISSEKISRPALPNVPAIPATVATSFLRNRSEDMVI